MLFKTLRKASKLEETYLGRGYWRSEIVIAPSMTWCTCILELALFCTRRFHLQLHSIWHITRIWEQEIWRIRGISNDVALTEPKQVLLADVAHWLSCNALHPVACNTIQYNTIQYNTIQYNTIQYNTIQYNTIQYNTIQYNTIQYNTIQYNTICPLILELQWSSRQRS